MGWTTEQQKVIDLRNKNIIVSAAAGSGKTAVLTERIAGKICADKNASIDRMLIVTFTNAAAAEMRDRIGKRLREKLAREPDNAHIRKQIAILHTAQITTIDSFCLYILKNHFEEIGVDPAFRIANDGEKAEIQNEAFDETIEELFLEYDDEFVDLVEMYAPKGKFGNLKELVFSLSNSAQSTPYPYETLEKCIVEDAGDIWNSDFVTFLNDYESNYLEAALEMYSEARDLLSETMLDKHLEEVNAKISFINGLLESDFRFRMRSFIKIPKVDLRYGRKAFDENTLEIKPEAEKLMNRGKKILENLSKKIHTCEEDSFEKNVKDGYKASNALIKTTLSFMKKFDEKKREAGIIDFNDMEHMALDILIEKDGDTLKPTSTALRYRDFFDEVMIDEYQDSNDVQETILGIVSKDEETTGNRFMVGDIKQSIYGFRLAKPDIFREKCEKYKKDEAGRDVRINLLHNFRSRGEVIDAVNFIFERCMQKSIGKIDYNEDEKLNLGNTDYKESPSDNTAEFIYFLESEKNDNPITKQLSNAEYEAAIIAQRILELKEAKTQVYDRSTDSMREMEFSDIAILCRALSGGKDIVFQNVLTAAGIPAYVISKTGYYGAKEVQLILNLLSVIDNSRQDLPLLGVMHSFIGGFSEEEIARIRLESRNKRLSDSLYQYLLLGEDEEIKAKIEKFTDELEELKKMSVYMPASDMLREIYARYDYTVMVSSLPNGEQRLANVKMLIDTAEEYEQQGVVGIHDFVKFIEKMKKREVDMGEANILDENANVVKIMTIHKSKGLEFPICFVSSLGTKFMDTGDKMLFDTEFGIGGEAFDLDKRTKTVSPLKNAIALKKAIDEKGEEIRVLYVALTRAKEKLIMTGALSDDTKSSEILSFVDIMESRSFADMVFPLIKDSDLFEKRHYFSETYESDEVIKEVDKASRKDALLNISGEAFFEEYRYNKDPLDDLFVKTTVSELKKAAYLEREDGENTLYKKEEKKIPAFISKEEGEAGGAARGSAYHRVMELMDFEHIYDGDVKENLRAHRAKMVEKLFIYEEDDVLVNEKKILKFLDTELSHRMSRAAKEEKLYLEQPFVLSVNASEVNPGFPSEEKILVQGVIDVYFEEDGKLVLMDYKTDLVASEDELIARYKTQLDYYSEALSRLEKKPVSEILIYSFSLGEVIEVK